MTIRLIVGLSNPGKEYASTRHNAGAWWVQELCDTYNANFKQETKLQSLIASVSIDNQNIKVAVPTTYMNNSGQAVGKLVKYFNIKPEEILIAHDELDFPAGTIKLKTGGGHGGHNGLRDIITAVGSKDFHRVRIGIGHPGDRNQVSNYVLAAPSKMDKESILCAIKTNIASINKIIACDFATAMNQQQN